jgi:hypothetical protein
VRDISPCLEQVLFVSSRTLERCIEGDLPSMLLRNDIGLVRIRETLGLDFHYKTGEC